MSITRAVLSAVSIPWSAFVAVFIYYTVLTLIAIGVADLSVAFVATAYLLPTGLYAFALTARGVRALSAMPIDIGPTPHALLR